VGAALRLHRLRERIRPLVPRGLRQHANRAVFAVVGLILAGKGVHCPCCERSYRHFFDYPSAYCPGCGSYERQRLLCLYLDRNPDLVHGDVLHVGPEACIMKRYRDKARTWLAIDLDPAHPLIDRTMDVTALALEDASFDLVLCSHVLDIVERHDDAIDELYRVTRLGGTALIQAPRRAVGPSPEAYAVRLKAPGFAVTVFTLEEQRDETARRRFGLDADEPIFVCERTTPP
jgi:SAM-dependent methyltransferase